MPMCFKTILLFSVLSISVNAQTKLSKKKVPDKLPGHWYQVRDQSTEKTSISRGLTFSEDSLEILEGVFEKDSTRQFAYNDYFYKGGKHNYSIIGDSVYIKSITYRKREFFGRIVHLSDDSLALLKRKGYVRAY
jgi:hypothetical protein